MGGPTWASAISLADGTCQCALQPSIRGVPPPVLLPSVRIGCHSPLFRGLGRPLHEVLAPQVVGGRSPFPGRWFGSVGPSGGCVPWAPLSVGGGAGLTAAWGGVFRWCRLARGGGGRSPVYLTGGSPRPGRPWVGVACASRLQWYPTPVQGWRGAPEPTTVSPVYGKPGAALPLVWKHKGVVAYTGRRRPVFPGGGRHHGSSSYWASIPRPPGIQPRAGIQSRTGGTSSAPWVPSRYPRSGPFWSRWRHREWHDGGLRHVCAWIEVRGGLRVLIPVPGRGDCPGKRSGPGPGICIPTDPPLGVEFPSISVGDHRGNGTAVVGQPPLSRQETAGGTGRDLCAQSRISTPRPLLLLSCQYIG